MIRDKAVTKSSAFLGKLLSEVRPIAKASLEGNERKILEARMGRHLFGLKDQEDQTPLKPLPHRQQFMVRIFYDYNEISTATNRLRQSEEFVMKLAKSSSVNAESISYHVEKYLEENYILKERLLAFLRRIAKLLKQKGMHELLVKVHDLEVSVEKSFSGIVRTRGSHIHVERFSDDELKRLATLDLLVIHGRMNELEQYRRLIIRKVVKKWSETIKTNNKSIQQLLDFILEFLDPVIFEKLPPPT